MDDRDCLKCPFYSMCDKGFVIDCDNGDVLDVPGRDYSSVLYDEIKAQNGEL